MTETLAQRIERHEGFLANPRPDAKGYSVVGFGHDITHAEADEYRDMTEDEARRLLDSDIAHCEVEVNRAFPWVSGLSRVRQDVLVEMAFQLGVFGLYGFRSMLAALRAGDYATAARDMLKSEWHHQTPARCEELANLMLNDGQDEATPWTRSPA